MSVIPVLEAADPVEAADLLDAVHQNHLWTQIAFVTCGIFIMIFAAGFSCLLARGCRQIRQLEYVALADGWRFNYDREFVRQSTEIHVYDAYYRAARNTNESNDNPTHASVEGMKIHIMYLMADGVRILS